MIKQFTPDAGATWLLTEIDPDDEDRAFGLCDLGQSWATFRLSELEDLRGSAAERPSAIPRRWSRPSFPSNRTLDFSLAAPI
ncbi:DUF2958 domain-containing protein [Tsuneonella deserti]|uniref:DUF2958 domain-containing protein n=1 Tax=Tsuneonella deserti TaxID=2035528 RepID=UPI001666BC19